MSYSINKQMFNKKLVEFGYRGIAEFSRKTGVHRNTIMGYLSGKGVLPLPLVQIAEALGVSPLSFITRRDTEKTEGIAPIANRIAKVDPSLAILLIGSRAKEKARRYSDWDIGITGGSRLVTTARYLHLKNLVEEWSEHMPTMVDLVNLDAAPLWFYEAMNYEPVFLDGNRETFAFFKGVLHGIRKTKQDQDSPSPVDPGHSRLR